MTREPSAVDDYFDLGPHTRPVTTSSDEAQTWFDRGLMWTYGFNHDEALRCFEAAATADPDCAMAHWGRAHVQGPFYNKPWKFYAKSELGPALEACRSAAADALAASGEATDMEKMLISAVESRYANAHMTSQLEFDASDNAYATAMKAAVARFPDDHDVVALAAEALITRTPWELWDTSTGAPADGASTEEAVALLEASIVDARTNDRRIHPGVGHMYLHAMEMSPRPEVALPVADAMRGYATDAAHLNHMPGHIDVLCGHYREALDASHRAVRADATYLAYIDDPGFYLTACAHDWHLFMYAAMLLGNQSEADTAVAGMRGLLPTTALDVDQPHLRSTLEAYYSMALHVDVRFGRWDTIAAGQPIDDLDLLPVTSAMSHYAHGVAFAALGRDREARQHVGAFESVRASLPPSRRFFNNAATDVLGVADALLAGEVEYHAGNHDVAFDHLRTAVLRDDALNYSEPWPWMHPPRHALGALLLEQGHVEEATAVYRADLGLDPTLPRPSWHPNNVWSLHGLVECYDRAGDTTHVEEFTPQLSAALEHVDFELTSSCACRMGCCD